MLSNKGIMGNKLGLLMVVALALTIFIVVELAERKSKIENKQGQYETEK